MARCRRHNHFMCRDAYCRADRQNAGYGPGYVQPYNSGVGDLSYDASSGDLAIGIGGGLAIDTANGDLAIDLGGVAFDIGGGSDSFGGGDFF